MEENGLSTLGLRRCNVPDVAWWQEKDPTFNNFSFDRHKTSNFQDIFSTGNEVDRIQNVLAPDANFISKLSL